MFCVIGILFNVLQYHVRFKEVKQTDVYLLTSRKNAIMRDSETDHLSLTYFSSI